MDNVNADMLSKQTQVCLAEQCLVRKGFGKICGIVNSAPQTDGCATTLDN
jgi:hypothetical protein